MKKTKSFNYGYENTACNLIRDEELTAYSGNNPFFQKFMGTDENERDVSRDEARKEYWPFLESV